MHKQTVQHLEEFMTQNNLTMQEVADELSVAVGTVNNWLKGRHGISRRHSRTIEELISKRKDDNWLNEIVKGKKMTKEEAKIIIDYLDNKENKIDYLELLLKIEKKGWGINYQ
ncbi:MAG: helix-turn-helix domain-containing protein [Lentisphaerae bacterium]|nr:helix-turn-helix domain-containing protein [Lentisphaerota bacterium]MCP4101337.1 helix-turn-helix domain-containing protein [Lentisphaerota bacterium]